MSYNEILFSIIYFGPWPIVFSISKYFLFEKEGYEAEDNCERGVVILICLLAWPFLLLLILMFSIPLAIGYMATPKKAGKYGPFIIFVNKIIYTIKYKRRKIT